MSRCAHCFEPIESFNGYDYGVRGVTWRHEKTKEVHCRTTVAEPMPEACLYCRSLVGHTPTCVEVFPIPEGNRRAKS